MNIVSKPPPAATPIGLAPETPWQRELREAIRDPAELAARLDLGSDWLAAAAPAVEAFGLFVTRGYLGRMRPGDPADPLLLQILPTAAETRDAPGFRADAVGDLAAQQAPGLLHKYRGRALLIATGACAIHCRYCFRRGFPYGEMPHGMEQWAPALDQLAADPTIAEVILSGGDPLVLADRWLTRLVERIAEIGYVRRLRIHTRLPIVVPQRVTDELLAWLRGTRLTPVMVVHANHAQEIDAPVASALARLVDAGVPVLNQTVLLRGINDRVSALAELCQRLIDLRVMPYYLHQLDRAQGTAHFEASIARGRRIMAGLRRRLPGYAVPRYVCEVSGRASKTRLA